MVYIEQILLTLTSGGASLADAERLNDDKALKALLGIERFPYQTSPGEWLHNVGTEGWQALCRINRDLARWILNRAQPGRYEHAGRLECFFNDTQIEVSGLSFEEPGRAVVKADHQIPPPKSPQNLKLVRFASVKSLSHSLIEPVTA